MPRVKSLLRDLGRDITGNNISVTSGDPLNRVLKAHTRMRKARLDAADRRTARNARSFRQFLDDQARPSPRPRPKTRRSR